LLGHARFAPTIQLQRNSSSPKEKKKMKSSTQDKVEGTAKNIAGRIKEVTGKAVGNPRLQADGKAEKVEGKIQKKVGEIKKVLGN
jgi:uncharacterized protein YjbJ (UPF0337 family)